MVHQAAWQFGHDDHTGNPASWGEKTSWFPAKNPWNHMDVNGIGNRPTYFPKLYHSNTELSIWLNNESQFTNNHIQEWMSEKISRTPA